MGTRRQEAGRHRAVGRRRAAETRLGALPTAAQEEQEKPPEIAELAGPTEPPTAPAQRGVAAMKEAGRSEVQEEPPKAGSEVAEEQEERNPTAAVPRPTVLSLGAAVGTTGSPATSGPRRSPHPRPIRKACLQSEPKDRLRVRPQNVRHHPGWPASYRGPRNQPRSSEPPPVPQQQGPLPPTGTRKSCRTWSLHRCRSRNLSTALVDPGCRWVSPQIVGQQPPPEAILAILTRTRRGPVTVT